MNESPRPATRRKPLGEATRRVNNSQQQPRIAEKHLPIQHDENRNTKPGRGTVDSQRLQNPSHYIPDVNAVNPRLSAIANEYPASNRSSQISTTSTNSEGRRLKASIGPWKLGKTLGRGATARVRLARHTVTGQEAAVKIVQKKNAYLSQAGSLADLDRAEASIVDCDDGLRRMPVGIEREVAIMKLIQHPNIMKLHDIWENRTEIYLVLEYVENGELFDHISQSASGRLTEEEALRCFRQIFSAVGYCHSFNICHRDLKPENILLTKDGQIKIADFGMAALHQGPDHKLETSCGSPHYAAPELIRGSAYRGDMVDIWSMGVILYATLAGRLPFDTDSTLPNNLPLLLSKIKKGHYEMPSDFSSEAKSLIRRMLQVNPKDRITLPLIWKHPLLRKYDYLDNLSGGGSPQSSSVRHCGRPVLKRSDISKDLLRNLRSMWHKLSEEELLEALLNDKPNEQKLFYSLLLKYRDAQLENYTPDIGYSTSDYHHIKPINLTKTFSTCHFPSANTKGHGRYSSKFTLISNVADSEQSYDPFKASRPQHLNGARDDRAFVTVHRTEGASRAYRSNITLRPQNSRKLPVITASDRTKKLSLAPPRFNASRTSMTSSTRSRSTNPSARVGLGYKRGVSFVHLRRHSVGSPPKHSDKATPTRIGRYSNNTEVTDDGGDMLRAVQSKYPSTEYIRSKKASPTKGRASLLWSDDVRQLSSSLAKDCDEAFNRTSITSNAERSQAVNSTSNRTSFTKYSSNEAEPARRFLSTKTRDNDDQSLAEDYSFSRAPARSNPSKVDSLHERKRAGPRKQSEESGSIGQFNRSESHIEDLIQTVSSSHDRRINSAPVDTRRISLGQPLASIHESRCEEPSPRIGPAPSSQPMHQRQLEPTNGRIASAPEARPAIRETIRVVNSMSFPSPVKAPAPLSIMKKSSQIGPQALMSGALDAQSNVNPHWYQPPGTGLLEQFQPGAEANLEWIGESRHDESGIQNGSSSSTVVRRKPGWLKRNSKSEEENVRGSRVSSSSASNYDAIQPPYERPPNPHLTTRPGEAPKKKVFSFARFFKKRTSKPDMAIIACDPFDDDASFQDSVIEYQNRGYGVENGAIRQIAPQRNWLAKLFNVKPLAKSICFSISKKKARKEITAVLKEWKRYGIRDIQVDKERNIVFGKVDPGNFLHLKPCTFAGEIMTIIEHGKRGHLSIARFTQEQGAASSFHKVVDTLEAVLECRGVLVSDERKTRMMVKTLNSI